MENSQFEKQMARDLQAIDRDIINTEKTVEYLYGDKFGVITGGDGIVYSRSELPRMEMVKKDDSLASLEEKQAYWDILQNKINEFKAPVIAQLRRDGLYKPSMKIDINYGALAYSPESLGIPENQRLKFPQDFIHSERQREAKEAYINYRNAYGPDAFDKLPPSARQGGALMTYNIGPAKAAGLVPVSEGGFVGMTAAIRRGDFVKASRESRARNTSPEKNDLHKKYFLRAAKEQAILNPFVKMATQPSAEEEAVMKAYTAPLELRMQRTNEALQAGFDGQRKKREAGEAEAPLPAYDAPPKGVEPSLPTSRLVGVIDRETGELGYHPGFSELEDGAEMTAEEQADAEELFAIRLNSLMGRLPREDMDNEYDEGFTHRGRLVREFGHVRDKNGKAAGLVLLPPEDRVEDKVEDKVESEAMQPKRTPAIPVARTRLEAALAGMDYFAQKVPKYAPPAGVGKAPVAETARPAVEKVAAAVVEPAFNPFQLKVPDLAPEQAHDAYERTFGKQADQKVVAAMLDKAHPYHARVMNNRQKLAQRRKLREAGEEALV